MRVIFMGSPRFAVPSLEQLLLAKYDVTAVYTQPDRPSGRGRSLTFSPVKEVALRWGIPVKQPEDVKSSDSLAELETLKPDTIVICAYGQILNQAFLDIPPRQCLNVHFSLLPRHRGASPVAAAILAGDDFAGVSIQLVRLKLDTGPVLATASVPVMDEDDTVTLTEKLGIVGARILDEAVLGWLNGNLEPITQDESKATYFGQVKKEDGEIDWQRPAQEIWRRVRAYYPWPGCFTYWKGRQLKINRAMVLPGDNNKEPGCVIELSPVQGGVGIATGKGILGVLDIQYSGKKAMSATDFLRGQRDFIGSRLPC